MTDLFRLERFASEIPAPAVTLKLPWPPALNHYYRTAVVSGHAQTYISPAGKRYRKNVYAVRFSQGRLVAPLTSRLHVEILLTEPDRRRRDIDGIPKAVLDALTKAAVWGDNSQIDRLVIARAGVQRPGWIEVRIAELD